MKIEISQSEIKEIKLTSPIGRGTNKTSCTYYTDIILSFEDGLKISSQVNLLPLFWKNQSYTLPKKLELNLDKIELTVPFFNMIKITQIPKNYHFALESVFLTYLTQKKYTHLIHDYTSSPRALTSTLIVDTASKSSINSIQKIKIGIQDAQSENKRLKELAKHSTLRLDGNQSLEIEQLENILKDLDPMRIEYIEEPFKNFKNWDKFKNKDEFKLALDETITEFDIEELISYADFLIIKPTYNFSISEIYKYLKRDISFILSSSYEPDYCLNVLIHLAELLSFNKKKLTHGFGTTKYLDQDAKFLQRIDNKTFVQGYPFFQNIL